MEMEVTYHKQKPGVVRTAWQTSPNDNDTYLYLTCFQSQEVVNENGIEVHGLGIMYDYFGHAVYVSVDLKYWEEIKPEEFFLSCPNMLGKAKVEREKEQFKLLSN